MWLAQNPLGKIEHQAAWSPRGELGRWTIANPAVAKIGNSVFVHGGISVRYAGFPISEINRRTAAALTAADEAPDSILHEPFGPLWYRGLVTRTAEPPNQATAPEQPPAAPVANYPSIEDELATVLRSFGASRLVIGHTPRLAGIEVLHAGRLVRIEADFPRHYGEAHFLEIVGDGVPHNSTVGAAPRRQ